MAKSQFTSVGTAGRQSNFHIDFSSNQTASLAGAHTENTQGTDISICIIQFRFSSQAGGNVHCYVIYNHRVN